MRETVLLVLLSLLVQALAMADNFTNPDDVRALQQLRDMINRSNLELSGWLDKDSKDPCGAMNCGLINAATEPCAWQGLACLDGRILGIAIEGSSRGWLGGAVPTILPTSLRTLQLPSNRLTGALKDASCGPGSQTLCQDRWSDLKELEVVDLSFNNITGGLPSWKDMRLLQMVRLKENHLTGQLPEEWKHFRVLQDLDLSFNNLGGELPRSWGELPALEKLNLAWNQLSESVPETWVNMAKLEQLDITGNCAICGEVQGRVPENVYNSGLLAQNTNVRKDCGACNGCNCDSIPLGLFRHALISVSVLLGVFLLICLRKLCLRIRSRQGDSSQSLPIAQPQMFPSWAQPATFEKAAVIMMPDGKEVCMGKQVEEDKAYESSIDFPDTSTSSELSSDEEAEEAPITFVATGAHFGALETKAQQQGIRRRGASYSLSVGGTVDGSESESYDSYESDTEAPSEGRFSEGFIPVYPTVDTSVQKEELSRSQSHSVNMIPALEHQAVSGSLPPTPRRSTPRTSTPRTSTPTTPPDGVGAECSGSGGGGPEGLGQQSARSLFLASQKARKALPLAKAPKPRNRSSRRRHQRDIQPVTTSLPPIRLSNEPSSDPLRGVSPRPGRNSRGSLQLSSNDASPDLSQTSPLPIYIEDLRTVSPEYRRRIAISRLKDQEDQ